MKTTNKAVHPKLKQLKAKIGGTIREDGELYHGRGKRQIFISTKEDGKDFWFCLRSQRPLYMIRDGRPHLVKQRSSGGAKGWYGANVMETDVETAIQLAEAQSDPEIARDCVLHDYCLRHLDEIENGLSLCVDGGIVGVEVPAGGQSIDILAVDTAMNYVVIETKRAKAKRQTVDQLLGYMGWVRKHVAKPRQGVRGIIIAQKISADLQLAASGVPDIDLIEYHFSFKFMKVAGQPKKRLFAAQPENAK